MKANEVHDLLQLELLDAVFCNIDSVWGRYLGNVMSDTRRKEVLQGWSNHPNFTDAQFVPWVVKTLNECAAAALRGHDVRTSITTGPSGLDLPLAAQRMHHWVDTKSKPFPGAYCTTRRPDFVLVSVKYQKVSELTWKRIHVVGEHQSKGKSELKCILQLADYASQMFAHQGTRIFVPAILTSNKSPEVKLMVFDRAGAIVSTAMALDVMLPEIAAAYVCMSKAELGYDEKSIKSYGANFAVLLPSGVEAVLKEELCRRPGIVCRGTFCSVAIPRDVNLPAVVVKWSWRAKSRKSEGALLELAKRRRVICIARHIAHIDVGDIDLLSRGGIKPTEPPVKFAATASPTSSRQASGASNCGALQSAAQAWTSATHNHQSEINNRIAELNRVYTQIITTPVGIPIEKCTTAVEVAEALLGALVGHASLFFQGNILHRDVSISNIMYTGATTPFPLLPDELASYAAFLPPGPIHGFLIDLDYAIEYPPVDRCGAPHRTGTLPFMSIRVLRNKPHRYRDDLESFLYVLLWICIVPSKGPPPGSILARWLEGQKAVIAGYKYYQMHDAEEFEELLGMVRLQYLPLVELARKWHGLLFKQEIEWDAAEAAQAEIFGEGGANMKGFVLARNACWEVLRGLGRR